MKMYIISNGDGEILGTAPVKPIQAEEDAPERIGLIPEPDQVIYEVDMPDEVLELPALELHTKYQLRLKHATAELIMREKR